MNREELKQITLETMRILERRESYNNVNLNISQMVNNTELIKDLDIKFAIVGNSKGFSY
ncbi:MAG: hypothetical protein RSE41_05205 [Clostridia bacterium]